ncbi:MAG: response regulator, partial [Spirochaetes bacterium]|nr:response regulator [Spirochaetota bacterium]
MRKIIKYKYATSLFSKFLIIISIVLFFILIVTGMIYITYHENSIEKLYNLSAERVAENIAKICSPHLAKYTYLFLDEDTIQFQNNEEEILEILSVQIYDVDGKLVNRTFNEPEEIKLKVPEKFWLIKDIPCFYKPLPNMEEERVGSVKIIFSIKSLFFDLLWIRLIYVISVILTIVLIDILIVYILSRLIINPINRLAYATKRVSYDNLNVKIPVISNDEIGDLAKTFNNMIDKLNKSLIKIKGSEEKSRSYIENSPIGIFIISGEQKLKSVNEAACIMTAYSEEELLRKEFGQILSEQSKSDGYNHFYKLSQFGAAYDEFEFIRADGSLRNMSVNAVKISDDEYIAFAQDITDRLRIDNELKESKETAENALVVKSKFLSNMNHELRTPLTGILGMINMMNKTKLDEEQKKFLAMMKKSGDLLLNIVNDILDISKIESGKRIYTRKNVNLRELLDSLYEVFKISADNKGIELYFNYDDDLQDIFLTDETFISQIVINLVNNAIKFTEKGKAQLYVKKIGRVVKNSINLDKQKIEITVCDTGIGIPEDKIENIFERFSQIDSSYRKKFAGTGLGLSIVKSLIEAMNGTVTVKSREYEGTCFTINLELEIPDGISGRTEEGGTESAADYIVYSDFTVMVVEDNGINLYYLSEILAEKGFKVITANNGKKALESFYKNKIDIILMDIQMPEMDGITCSTIIREDKNNAAIPIIALTGYTMEE